MLSLWYDALAWRMLYSASRDPRVDSLSITKYHWILEVGSNHWSLPCTILPSKTQQNYQDHILISQKMESPLFLWATCASVPSPSKFKRCPGVQMKVPLFQFVPIASSSAAAHCWKKPDSVLFVLSLQVFIYIGKMSPEPGLPQSHHLDKPVTIAPYCGSRQSSQIH